MTSSQAISTSPLPSPPLTISIPTAKTSTGVVCASVSNSSPALQPLDTQDEDAEEGLDHDAVDHYTYNGPNNYTVQPFFASEPESPSPILPAWPSTQLNPDYLVPYHPSVHKNITNYSQILLDQIRQKSASAAPAEPSNAVSGVGVAAPSTFKGISILPSALSSATNKEPSTVEKYFVFQPHQRELQGSEHSSRHPSRSHPKTLCRRAAQSLRPVTRFFKRLSRSVKGTASEQPKKGKEKAAEPSTLAPPQPGEPVDLSFQYLQARADNNEIAPRNASEQEHDQQRPQEFVQSIQHAPKVMKILDKIKNHVTDHHDNKQEQPSNDRTHGDEHTAVKNQSIHTHTATPPAAVAISALQKKKNRGGPRMHPKLLELYEVTDHVLGVGTFATVKEIKLKSTDRSYALKTILKKTLQGKGAMLDTEIAVLSKVRHPNCVSLLEMFETEDAVYLVTDLAAGGELFEQLLNKGSYTEGDAARLIHEILLGVEYLHSMDIVHRDLKPENLLFFDTTENARLMITDFGLSKILTNGNDVLMTACGTPGYVAPEVLEKIGHGKPVDMWSVGIIAYTLLCGYAPFWGEDQPTLFENIIAGQYEYEDEYWKDISPLAKKFIDSLLVRPAEKRPTATQALSHPWFRTVLDQGLTAPASPSDSVDLLPSVRKNFNATNVFKKAVRAVGILRRMQGAQQHGHTQGVSLDSTSEGGARMVEVASVDGIKNPRFSFHDVVSAAMLSKQGIRLDAVSDESNSGHGPRIISESEEHLEKISAVLEDLTIKAI
ncbi:kinase-like domain-containing protein [Gamsiella multidivaricata]|uniref:kinase-like domain-containing protein n=1 Tax=Gamsiella multidivaricata TaxID=101098 RepID=UPI00221E497F|nr:kinase-like domain-containing protein [Gamsiella multidivaricata]KAI7822600.1 kinase-like domain-containing protein [Gamsiella multidivaricata]